MSENTKLAGPDAMQRIFAATTMNVASSGVASMKANGSLFVMLLLTDATGKDYRAVVDGKLAASIGEGLLRAVDADALGLVPDVSSMGQAGAE